MKKFLTVTLAIAMGATLVGALAACANGDADTAKEAIKQLNTLYDNAKYYETRVDFTRMGQIKVGTDSYVAVNWSVSSTVENIGDYVSVGEMNATTKQVSISITQGAEAVEYKLHASVTVGKATEKTEFSHKVPAAAVAHAGTLDDPFSVENVLSIGATLASEKFYEVDGAAKQIYVKGYVVDPGTLNDSAGRLNNAYIVDEYSADKTSASAGALQVYTLTYDDTVFTGQYPFVHGDLVVLTGWIENYRGTIEITYNGSGVVNCVSLTPGTDTRTAEKKVADVLKLAEQRLTKSYEAEGTADLPLTSVRGVTLDWTVATNDYVEIDNGKLKINSLPTDADKEIALTATASVDGKNASKEIKITLKKGIDLGLEHKGTEADPYSVADVEKLFAEYCKNDKDIYKVNGVDKEVYIKGFVTVGGTAGASRLDNVYIADVAGTEQKDSVLVFAIAWDDEKFPAGTTLTVGDQIVITGYLKNYSGTKEIAQSSSSVYPKIVKLTAAPDDRTPAKKVEDALAALTLPDSYSGTMDNVKLPVSTVRDVTITWTSSNEELIKIAEDGKTMNILSIPDAATPVTVTATATIKNETVSNNTKQFTITLSKDLGLEHAGTEADPFSVADALKILNTLKEGASYNDDAGKIKEVWVSGIVSDAGSANANGLSKIYVGATADATHANSVYVYSTNWSNAFKSDTKLRVGDTVVVHGWLKDYKGTKEMADDGASKNKVYPTITSFTPRNRTAAEKIDDARYAVPKTLADIKAVKEVTLPASKVTGVTFAWSVVLEEGASLPAGIAVEDGKVKVTALPASDATLTLKVTASCGDAEDAVQTLTVTVKATDPNGVDFAVDAETNKTMTEEQATFESNGITVTVDKNDGTEENASKGTAVNN
ncbi:MAG: hypothetical protein K2N74_05575, partial [Clostridiales bacterium]|nr:hypothetical protein [Clostridiales bacterium]